MAEDERVTGLRICPSADLAEGGDGHRFTVSADGKEAPAFVVRFKGQVHGWLNRCSHMPVELDWQPTKFFDTSGLYLICATHGALYAPDTGRCVAGRCMHAGLILVSVTEVDGWIVVNEEGGQGVGRE
jgi:nitrite reductase/ring-hydroxylating ferredoxin subunit